MVNIIEIISNIIVVMPDVREVVKVIYCVAAGDITATSIAIMQFKPCVVLSGKKYITASDTAVGIAMKIRK
jgi:hypothetical protein